MHPTRLIGVLLGIVVTSALPITASSQSFTRHPSPSGAPHSFTKDSTYDRFTDDMRIRYRLSRIKLKAPGNSLWLRATTTRNCRRERERFLDSWAIILDFGGYFVRDPAIRAAAREGRLYPRLDYYRPTPTRPDQGLMAYASSSSLVKDTKGAEYAATAFEIGGETIREVLLDPTAELRVVEIVFRLTDANRIALAEFLDWAQGQERASCASSAS